MVAIPLGDGFVGWGRQLRSVRVEFYNRFDAEAETERVDPIEVAGSEVVFTVAVRDCAFRGTSKWTPLEVVPLSKGQQTDVYRSLKQDALSGALSIYREKPDGSWGQAPATRAECAGLERSAVWDPQHVEDRLRDHRDDRPNKWTKSLALEIDASSVRHRGPVAPARQVLGPQRQGPRRRPRRRRPRPRGARHQGNIVTLHYRAAGSRSATRPGTASRPGEWPNGEVGTVETGHVRS